MTGHLQGLREDVLEDLGHPFPVNDNFVWHGLINADYKIVPGLGCLDHVDLDDTFQDFLRVER